MADDWDEKRRVFVTASGRVRTRAEIRAAIDDLEWYAKRRARNIASAYYRGSISEDEFILQMRELLTSGHLISAAIGIGGIAAMTTLQWMRVKTRLAWQFRFLGRFARKIRTGAMTEKAVMRRAELYPNAFLPDYYQGVQRGMRRMESDDVIKVKLVQNSKEGCPDCKRDAARGWVPVGELAEIGSRACGSHCKCDLHFSTDDPNYSGPGNQL